MLALHGWFLHWVCCFLFCQLWPSENTLQSTMRGKPLILCKVTGMNPLASLFVQVAAVGLSAASSSAVSKTSPAPHCEPKGKNITIAISCLQLIAVEAHVNAQRPRSLHMQTDPQLPKLFDLAQEITYNMHVKINVHPWVLVVTYFLKSCYPVLFKFWLTSCQFRVLRWCIQ